MDLYELTTCSFIVKIWLEERSDETGTATWRGHVTHVPSGRRKHFEDLAEIIAFILPYLRAMGIVFGNDSAVDK